MILNRDNHTLAREYLKKIVDTCIDFKLQECVRSEVIEQAAGQSLLEAMPQEGMELRGVLKEFEERLLRYCTNFSCRNFMGFPDSGNSVAAMAGAIFAELLQQNLINQSFCGPSATFAEIAVIQWLREVVDYPVSSIDTIWDVGGVITPGGTSSNAIAVMLARENHAPGTMERGLCDPSRFKIIMPTQIGHYSIRSSQMWLGCGDHIVEVPIEGFKMDLHGLAEALQRNQGKTMMVVAYAGDSRTMAIDNLPEVHDLVKNFDENIWLHADACHGFSLGFSTQLKHKIRGIELFDSVSTDPHKVLCCPYVVSAVLVKDPQRLRSITSKSDLIMREDFAFGQVTPFLGSRNWASLKLWFLIKSLGRQGLGEIIERRHSLAQYLHRELVSLDHYVVLNEVSINSVMFMYRRPGMHDLDVTNTLNRNLHQRIINEGKYHLHQFPVVDNNGALEKNAVVYPLRFMCGNPNSTEGDIDNLIAYVDATAKSLGGK